MNQPTSADRPTVLFVCVHNAGRSQMAAGYLQHLAGARIQVLSAGSQPAEHINPVAVRSMAEDGIDITTDTPKLLTDSAVQQADVVVTMGCGDACPFVPSRKTLDWQIPDPKALPLSEFRVVRDIIGRKVQELLDEIKSAAR